MENYITDTLCVEREIEPARKLTALGGDFDFRWNDRATLSTSAYNALMSSFLAAGGDSASVAAKMPGFVSWLDWTAVDYSAVTTFIPLLLYQPNLEFATLNISLLLNLFLCFQFR